MDPDEALRLLRATLAQMQHDIDHGVLRAHGREALEYLAALDDWLTRGGYLPEDWQRGRER